MIKIGKILRFISIFVLCFQYLGIINSFSYAIDDVETIEPTNEISVSNIDVNLKPTISSPVVDINNTVKVSFDNAGVLSYSIETDGLTAVEVTNGSMEYDITVTDEFGVLDIYATYADDIVIKSSVYTYMNNDTVYVSDVSQDQAWYDCMKLKLDNNEITLDEFQSLYYQLTSRYIEEYMPDGGSSSNGNNINDTTIIQGNCLWEEDPGIDAPMISMKLELIKVVNGQEISMGTQYTKSDGSFCFEFNDLQWSNNGENIFIRILVESETFKVTNDWIINPYRFRINTHNILQGSTINFNIRIPLYKSSNHYKAIYVHQAMTVAERFAIDMGMSVPDYESENERKTKLNVVFPYLVWPIDSAFCLGNDYLSVANIGKSYWNNVDIITHEYGHYVQYLMDCYGASLVEIACNIPIHDSFKDHFVDKAAKEYAMELTWSEAWASVFSTLSENYCRSKGEYINFDDMVGCWCMGYNLETPTDHNGYNSYDNGLLDFAGEMDNRGEAQEMAVKAFLWDLYDTPVDTSDNISIGYQNWWNYTTVSGMYTLEDFTNHIDIERPDLRNGVASILEEHKISPKISYISSCSYSVPPKVEWTVNGSEAHPNNRFVIYFYDNNNRYLGETAMIESNLGHRDIEAYTIPNNVWNSVLEAAGVNCGISTTINISVGGYRYDTTWVSDENRALSGPYRSSYYSINIIEEHNYVYDNPSETQHSKTCTACGHNISDSHTWAYTKVSNTHHKKYCIECNYNAGTSLHLLKGEYGSDYKQCTACKALIDTGGNDIFPMLPTKKEDIEEETE